MGSKGGGDTKRAGARVRWRPVSSGRALASATVAALGVLTPIYLATDTGLSGPRFLLAILLATSAVLLIVEGINRARLARPWHSLVALGVLAEVVSLLIVLVPSSQGGTVNRHGDLRLGLRPTAPELFAVAFSKPIPWPSASEGWSDLHRRGGIDVHDSHFRLILANDSPAPISVLSVKAEVLGSKPLPHGTYAWRYTQGDEGVGKLVTLLPSGRRGSVAKTYPGAERAIDAEALATMTPYFETKYILLQSGEVYPATLTVQAETPKTIRYRLTAEGESAKHHFVVHSPTYQIVGRFEDPYQRLFARYYSKGHDPHACSPTPNNPWADARLTDRFGACPHGLNGSYEIPPPSSSRYPPGDLDLHLGVDPKKQSVTINGIVLGAAPAAVSRSHVAKPLLESLGAWDLCSVYSPNPHYWTARWDRWDLSLTFASEGASDCTDSSRAGVREVSLGGGGITAGTDFGAIEIGAKWKQLPPAVKRLAKPGELSEYRRRLVVPGVLPCDPGTPDPSRLEVDDQVRGGILALAGSEDIEILTSTLPAPTC